MCSHFILEKTLVQNGFQLAKACFWEITLLVLRCQWKMPFLFAVISCPLAGHVGRAQQFPILPLGHAEFWERQFCSPCCASAWPFQALVFLSWPKVVVKFKTCLQILNKSSKKCKENISNSGVEYKQGLEGYHILSHRSSLVTCCRPLPVNKLSDFGFDPAVPFLGSYCSKSRNLLEHVKHLADMLCPSRARKASQVVPWRGGNILKAFWVFCSIRTILFSVTKHSGNAFFSRCLLRAHCIYSMSWKLFSQLWF